MRFYAIVGLVVLTGAAVLVGLFGASVRTFIEVGLLAAILAPEAVRRSPRLYLAWHRLIFTLRNTPATWDVHVQFRLDSQVDLASVVDGLMAWAGRDSTVMASEGGRFVLRIMRRFVLELHQGEQGLGTPLEQEGAQTDVSIAPFTIGYRTSRGVLEGQLMPLLERLRDLLRPSSVVYSLRVDLPGDNPFFGLYADQLKLHHVQDFKIELQIPTNSHPTRVRVGTDRMIVIADTLENFRSGTVAALAYQLPRG